MKKFKTEEERVNWVAKTLVKEFKASEDKDKIRISAGFTYVTSSKFNGTHVIWRYDYKESVDFGDLSEEGLANITCRIADAICSKMKLKKNEILFRNTEEHTKWASGWYGSPRQYVECKSIGIVRPCKAFFAINKKLKALGLNEINFKDWYRCDVSGKRSSIFSRDYSYYAESEEKCEKVLAYLKGKKKVSYDYVSVDDLDDRRRGEEYETEWYGSETRQIRFTDSKGKKTIIY